MKENKGVTLVALVVTIIVLIILAGVSMNMLVGENGVVTLAQKARENIELTRVEEEKQLNSLYEELAKGGEGIFDDSMADAIEKLENFRKVIATAITNEGVQTSELDTADTMAENIGKILQERTKDATATAEDITEGKTAYVNGEKIIGTGNIYHQIFENATMIAGNAKDSSDAGSYIKSYVNNSDTPVNLLAFVLTWGSVPTYTTNGKLLGSTYKSQDSVWGLAAFSYINLAPGEQFTYGSSTSVRSAGHLLFTF